MHNSIALNNMVYTVMFCIIMQLSYVVFFE